MAPKTENKALNDNLLVDYVISYRFTDTGTLARNMLRSHF